MRRQYIRDGPKFGERRSLAEELGQMFGLATCELFGRTLEKFSFTFVALCLRRFVSTQSDCTL